ncbi:c-type cytochrome [Nitrosomonas marina]|uniref:Cytochrome c553 n=1 Tax=Nitrosomonas marina TaxID=917 RepID=A0A1H8CG06_9PROT|nr:c-type cytochrome [Nitrosomonas marina]SEM93027.1 Cytochrome c553 [Nitrosomonas marina]
MKILKNSFVVASTLVIALSSPAFAAGDVARGQEIAAGVCAGCHNPDGNSIIPINPSLAGQHAEYITKQLMDFKAEEGEKPNRNSPVMASMVAPLSQQDMEDVAAYYAAQTPEPAGNISSDEDLLEMGKIMYHGGNIENGVPACASCHGPTGTGIPPHYPALAAQHAEYTYTQLDLFNKAERGNDNGVMQKVLTRMSGAEKRAVAEYIQSMDVQ